jgi:hypothetical protein
MNTIRTQFALVDVAVGKQNQIALIASVGNDRIIFLTVKNFDAVQPASSVRILMLCGEPQRRARLDTPMLRRFPSGMVPQQESALFSMLPLSSRPTDCEA